MNFLKKQDPVRFRGAEAGTVRNIYLKDGKTCVRIETREPLEIHENYRIVADAKGFMGDRYIEIDPGDERKPAIGPHEPLSGIFPMGPVEGIAYVAELSDKIGLLNIMIDKFMKEEGSLENGLDVMIKKIDSFTVSLAGILNKARIFSSVKADTLVDALRNAHEATKKMTVSVPETVSALENISLKTLRILNAADSLTVSCELLLNRLNSIEAGLSIDDIMKLRFQISSLRKFLNDLRENGLRLPARL
ncbi:MAG: MCE family protein [Chitinispirillaceae bacterium]|nr:MCE family protein [Chitinispirillaceae bacterium]